MYNQHTRGITTAGQRDLDERGGKKKDFVRDLAYTHTHTHTQKKELKKKLMKKPISRI